ncbi:peptidase U32 family protein [Polyangium sorediatum]|uniref:U32 family peptidase n=1 Tax=Polyangium sorediatum TaxID=889274 RepID=A0ABT6NL17_9BACT|nr:U32 family peptidase [Polyangium sorediatum]MDI1429009.1 U32 family peptidase [Polyangium sorediatum]
MSTPALPRRPEILAPAGDDAALRAAVLAGADAVYFGLQGFNARARAKNFDAEGLARTMAFLHEHGVRGYVTLNTLVFDEELENVENAVRTCAEAGVDAVIVQDLGVARIVRAIAPSLAIHASTQMTCTDAGAAELARELGASRVILARELSVDDIAAIRRTTDVEIEVFVHGALCIAYSGQCLTSEAIGGRSANRGACAQACRLPYELVVDGEKRDLGDHAYLLSPEDLEASALVPKLAALGVSSLKIEGRLKGPDYVAATTRLYRAALEASSAGTSEALGSIRKTALQTYSRGSGPGFLAGVDHQRLVEGRACDHRGLPVGELVGTTRARGKTLLQIRLAEAITRGDGVLVEGGFAGAGEIGGRVWTIAKNGADTPRAEAGEEVSVWLGPDARVDVAKPGRRVWKTDDPATEKAILAEIERSPRKVPLSIRVSGAIGEMPRFEASTTSGLWGVVTGDAPLGEARGGADVAAVLKDKLGRLGDTPFEIATIDADLPAGVMIPPSSLNRARRALVEALLASAARKVETTSVHFQDLVRAASPPDRSPPTAGLFVLCRTEAQAAAALDAGADGVYLDFLELVGTGAALRALRASRPNVTIGVAPPRIRKPGEEKIDRYLLSLEPDLLLVRGLGALREGAGLSIPRIGDFSLNVTNRLTAAEVLSRGLSAFTPSFDLDAAQLERLLDSPFGPFAEVVLHHPMPLFHMEHCVIAALLSTGKDFRDCGRPCEKHKVSLRDRAGMEHPVEADVGCRNTVFHAAAQSAASLASAATRGGVRRFRIELVRETAEDVATIVGTYRRLLEGKMHAPEVFRALRTEGGYGVVKGSLRVLPA